MGYLYNRLRDLLVDTECAPVGDYGGGHLPDRPAGVRQENRHLGGVDVDALSICRLLADRVDLGYQPLSADVCPGLHRHAAPRTIHAGERWAMVRRGVGARSPGQHNLPASPPTISPMALLPKDPREGVLDPPGGRRDVRIRNHAGPVARPE